jgi:hypothetical protein
MEAFGRCRLGGKITVETGDEKCMKGYLVEEEDISILRFMCG